MPDEKLNMPIHLVSLKQIEEKKFWIVKNGGKKFETT